MEPRQAAVEALQEALAELRSACEALRHWFSLQGGPHSPLELDRLARTLNLTVQEFGQQLQVLRSSWAEGRGNRLPANLGELTRAFRSHRTLASGNAGAAAWLLLFYAAECGLKALYLKRYNLQCLDQLRGQSLYETGGHDLNRWRQELRIPAEGSRLRTTFRIKRHREPFPLPILHQAWRYGPTLDRGHEVELIAALEKLCEYLEDELRR